MQGNRVKLGNDFKFPLFVLFCIENSTFKDFKEEKRKNIKEILLIVIKYENLTFI